MKAAMKRWKHRRMIRSAWPIWYHKPGTYGRYQWTWLRQYGHEKPTTLRGAFADFDAWLQRQGTVS